MDKTLISKLNGALKKFNTEVYKTGYQEVWEDTTTYRINNKDMIYDFDATLVASSEAVALKINGGVNRWSRSNKNMIDEIVKCIESHVSWLYV